MAIGGRRGFDNRRYLLPERKWFGHDPERFPEFSKRYQAELEESGALDELRSAIKDHPNATLLFAAHDEEHNNAVVLQHLLETK